MNIFKLFVFSSIFAVSLNSFAICVGPGECAEPINPTLESSVSAHVKKVNCEWEDMSIQVEINPVTKPLAGLNYNLEDQCKLIRWAVESGLGSPF